MSSAAENLQQLRATVLSLPHSARAQLANELIESLEKENEEADAIWSDEAERRYAEIKSGKVKPVPGIEVLRRIRQRKK